VKKSELVSQLFVVTTCKASINRTTNPNQYKVAHTHDNKLLLLLKFYYVLCREHSDE
jgi:hypothetical protein